MKKYLLLLMLLPFLAYSQVRISCESKGPGRQFPIASGSATATIVFDTLDYALIHKSALFLADDIERVTGRRPRVVTSTENLKGEVIIIGTIGRSNLIGELAGAGKIRVGEIENQWERFIIQTIRNPFPGARQALVIAGSDRRGAAFGAFTLSREMGVSPWYWWADVPVKQSEELYLEAGRYVSESPSIKYRGIFINDEAPALRNWAKEKFGGFNHEFYRKVYELILRNRGNFLWPAMWLPTAFADDDPENARLAHEYGIVISTTHHEPMMRAHHEWVRVGGGEWNYETNKEQLREFWRVGIVRMGNYESIVTLGMRGDGDLAMSDTANIPLLQRIIADQRDIIAGVTGKPAEETPQIWALYKEVQEFYERGMRIPDDVMILYANDNWGNVRLLPKREHREHPGGFGMYYHFNYVGAPVSNRFQNVTQIERVWEQLTLSYEWGVDDLWIVNVGDIKPFEFPISFFFDFAWEPSAISASDLPNYYVRWAEEKFGQKHAHEIANLLKLYTKYNSRRTPEMLSPDIYSLENYREADRVAGDFNQLLELSRAIYEQMPGNYKPAFFQLVHFPIKICARLNEMYVAAAKNRFYAELGGISAHYYANRVKELFRENAELTRQFHEDLLNGKWNHMMSQTHIGYTSWNHPPANKMPPISYIQPSGPALLGYLVEHGSEPAWGGFSIDGYGLYSERFPTFDPVNDQTFYLEIFNRGTELLNYSVTTAYPWIRLSSQHGTTRYHERVYVSVDWSIAPAENTSGEIIVSGAGREYAVEVPIRRNLPAAKGFVENNGVVSIGAANFCRKSDSGDIRWTVVPNLGRTNSSMIVEPMDAPRQTCLETAPRLEYTFTVFDPGEVAIYTYLSPTKNFQNNEGIKFAIAINDEEPQIINMHEGMIGRDWEFAQWWMESVANRIRILRSTPQVVNPGVQTLKLWMIDPGAVFQQFVIDAGGLKPSYLGPPESLYLKSNNLPGK